jgi:hypothetical protein
MLRFFGNAFRTVFVAALVLLAVALAPTVGRAFADAGAASREATLNQPVVGEPCAAFEVWFLDPSCGQMHASQARVNKAARMKHRLAHN